MEMFPDSIFTAKKWIFLFLVRDLKKQKVYTFFGTVVAQIDPHDSFTSFGSYQTKSLLRAG